MATRRACFATPVVKGWTRKDGYRTGVVGGLVKANRYVWGTYAFFVLACTSKVSQASVLEAEPWRSRRTRSDEGAWGNLTHTSRGAWWSASTGAGGAGGVLTGLISLIFERLGESLKFAFLLMNGEKQICPSFKQTNTLMDLPRAKQAWATGLPAITDRIWRWRESSWCHLCWLHAQRQGCCQGTQDGRPWSTCPVRRGWGSWADSVWRRDGFGTSNRPLVPTRS